MYIQSVGTEGGIIVPLKIMWQRHSRWLVVYRMNKMNYPLVAIVIPTLNEALFIRALSGFYSRTELSIQSA